MSSSPNMETLEQLPTYVTYYLPSCPQTQSTLPRLFANTSSKL